MSIANTAAFNTSVDVIVPRSLLLPGAKHVFQTLTFAPGLNLPVGAAVAVATSGPLQGFATWAIAGATDGTQNPTGITATPIYTFDSLGNPIAMTASCYRFGAFDISMIAADPSWTIPALRLALLDWGITTNSAGYSGN